MRLLSMLLTGNTSKLVSFFSMDFLFLFLPVSILGYAVTPKKGKRYFLLLTSLLFSVLVSGGMAAYLFGTAVFSYFSGRWLGHIQNRRSQRLSEAKKEEKKEIKKNYLKKQQRVLLLAVFVFVGGLLLLKYSGFFAVNINSLLKALHLRGRLPVPHFLLPVGISFFTLQALSYLVDVYHEAIPAEKNIFRLTLFLTFFRKSWKVRFAVTGRRQDSFGMRAGLPMKT